jgi:hypothetical protein
VSVIPHGHLSDHILSESQKVVDLNPQDVKIILTG